MIPGTVFMSLLAGALFGVIKGVALVVFTATAGASSCYFLSKLIGRPLAFFMWPDKLSYFQAQVSTSHLWSTVMILMIGTVIQSPDFRHGQCMFWRVHFRRMRAEEPFSKEILSLMYMIVL